MGKPGFCFWIGHRTRGKFDMQRQLEQRVTELEAEYRAGQEMLADLEAKHADLQQTLLRISGAIQVLKELLAADSGPAESAGPGDSAEPPPPGTPAPPPNGVLSSRPGAG